MEPGAARRALGLPLDVPLVGSATRFAPQKRLDRFLEMLAVLPGVHGVLAALDVFVLTSDREGMANAMLEAMAAGVPVVSTPLSGADEALAIDGEGRSAGLVAPPGPLAPRRVRHPAPPA